MIQHIVRLQVYNLRALQSFKCTFDPHVNEIIGDNGRGKTTILEAIYLLMTGGSFRTSFLKELVSHNGRGFIVEALFVKEGHECEMRFIFDAGKRQIFYNRSPCTAQLLIGLVNGVLATSQDSMLIQGAPALRRRFLDMQIAQADPLYVHHYARYNRALKQRNSLIREKKTATIDVWEKELARSGAYLIAERRKTIAALNRSVDYFFKNFIEDFFGHIQLKELSSCPVDADVELLQKYLEQEYARKRFQEIAYGQTLVGPHRHDLMIAADDRLCRDFASEGEVRILAIALRFAEWQQLYERTQVKPLFLADDLCAHLDGKRLQKVHKALEQLGQIIVTGQEKLLPAAEKTLNL